MVWKTCQFVVIQGQKDQVGLVLEEIEWKTADVVLVQQNHLDFMESSERGRWKSLELVVVEDQGCQLLVLLESVRVDGDESIARKVNSLEIRCTRESKGWDFLNPVPLKSQFFCIWGKLLWHSGQTQVSAIHCASGTFTASRTPWCATL